MGRKKKMPVAVQKRIKASLEEEELTKHGYSMSAKVRSRHIALGKAVREDGPTTVFRRLLLLRLWNRDRNPKLARIADQDAQWVGNKYGVKENGFRFT